MSLADNDKYKPRAVFSKISRLKNDLISPTAYAEDAQQMNDDRKRGQTQFLEIYRRYTAQCKANGAMDFDDLLVNMVVLFKGHPDVLEKYREKFQYILVDEYQDTNRVQYLIVKALSVAHGNICVVGDDSQSI
jgi:DNA helicase-2/ATP-dependent DNA helicase PcrA